MTISSLIYEWRIFQREVGFLSVFFTNMTFQNCLHDATICEKDVSFFRISRYFRRQGFSNISLFAIAILKSRWTLNRIRCGDEIVPRIPLN